MNVQHEMLQGKFFSLTHPAYTLKIILLNWNNTTDWKIHYVNYAGKSENKINFALILFSGYLSSRPRSSCRNFKVDSKKFIEMQTYLWAFQEQIKHRLHPKTCLNTTCVKLDTSVDFCIVRCDWRLLLQASNENMYIISSLRFNEKKNDRTTNAYG